MSEAVKNPGHVLSVVIRARNAEADLRKLLPILNAQSLPAEHLLQIVVVDNESVDGTREVSRASGTTVVEISTAEFSWGRALNCGIEACMGEIVLLLSSDAHPIGEDWLVEMCRPFSDKTVGGVYGRQIPRSSAPLDEWVRVETTFPGSGCSWSIQDLSEGGVPGLIASNACAAVRRSVWAKHRFDEESRGAEEIPWVSSVLKAGYSVRYITDAKVFHSHRESAMKQALRLWELELESRRQYGRQVRIVDSLRWIGGFAKSRVQNMFIRGSGIYRRLEGLCLLPFEMVPIAVVSLSTAFGIDFQTIRKCWK